MVYDRFDLEYLVDSPITIYNNTGIAVERPIDLCNAIQIVQRK